MSAQPRPIQSIPQRLAPDARALARVTGKAVRLADDIRALQRDAEPLSLTVRIEVNDLMEVLDLLRHKLHEATLARVIHHPPPTGRHPDNPEENDHDHDDR